MQDILCMSVYPTLGDKIYLTDKIQDSKFALLLEFVVENTHTITQ